VIDTGADLITLDRTDWSICLADYLAQSSVRRRVAPGLRNALAQRERPIRMQIIGMAEQGATSVVEHREALNRTSLIGQLLAHGESLVIDPSTHTDGLVELSNTPGIRTLVGIPLTTHGETIGGLVIASNTPNACSQQDLILLESIAGAIAAAIENVRLVAQIERRARELEAVSHHQELLLRTIMEISSPAVPIAQGILVMPLIGVIDNQRATRFMENLLIEINRHHAQIVLIDISSVSMVDTSVANHLVQAAQAARLLGAQVVLVGISPAVAQTIIQLGVNLSEITTRADLASGFSYALSQVGGRIVYR
jgi:anti-anti-sigma factor